MADTPRTVAARVEELMGEIDRDPILIAPTWQNYREAVRARLTKLLEADAPPQKEAGQS